MQPLTASDAKKWCRTQGAVLKGSGYPDRPNRSASFEIPGDAGRRIALVAKHLGDDFLGSKGKTLVWFHDWGVWPSGERMHVFERFLASYGDAHPLKEIPAFLFSRQEHEDVRSFVTLGVLFLWDVFVVRPNAHRLLFYSHDEAGWVA